MPTTWRVLDRVTEDVLPAVRDARAPGRAQAWAAGAGHDLTGPGAELRLDFDATSTNAHSEKENAAATWKRTFGFHHTCCAFPDRPEVAGGEALAGLLRAGNAGSNTAADHITVLDMALEALPEHAQPRFDADKGTWVGPSSGEGCWPGLTPLAVTRRFAQACVDRGVGFSFGFPVDMRIQRIVGVIPESCWHPPIQTDGDLREGRGWPGPPA